MTLRLYRSLFFIGLALACSTSGFAQNGAVKSGAAQNPSPSVPVICPMPRARAEVKAEQPIAIVGGKPIYQRDLTGRAAAQMLQIHQQEYKIQSDALDALIRHKLVEEEASKQGISVEKLYEKEVDSRIPDPSEAEVRGYYLAVRSQINQPFDMVESQLAKVVKALEIKQARQEYADSLRAKANVAILLQPPTVHVGSNNPARVRGNPDAPITIVEFGDFQCPYCSRVEPTLTNLLKKYKGKVNLAFRDFPLSSIHAHAEAAAEAARCAEEQGKFWQMHDAMYTDQAKLTEADLIKTAARLGMNQSAFAACLKSGKYKAAIQQDVAAGTRAGVTGTPTFFINGRLLEGSVPEAQFEKIIDSDLTALKGRKATVANR